MNKVKCPKCGGELADMFYDGRERGRGLVCFNCQEIYTVKDFNKVYPKESDDPLGDKLLAEKLKNGFKVSYVK